MLLVVLVMFGVACDGDPLGPKKDRTGASRTTEDPDAGGTPIEEPEAVEPFVPVRGDVYIGLKRKAGRLVQELTTYSDSESWGAVVERVSERFDVAPGALVKGKFVFLPGTSSAGEIVYPQLGGLALATEPPTASVMVLVGQKLDGSLTAEVSRTVDVRMVLDDERWRIASVESAGGATTEPREELSLVARSVLENPRIELADSARWDIYRGEIDDRLLQLMTRLARDHTYSVTVLKSGHPPNVYGTAQVSNHTEGRAVDIWKVDGRPVVSQRVDANSAAYHATQDVFDRGDVPEIGSPWDLDAGGSRSFTNDVHLDHLHFGYDF